MSKLLRAGMRRYTHSILFWLGIAFSVGMGLLSGYMSNWMFYFEDVYYMITLFAYAVVLSLIIGREFSDGIFRNKIIAGHSKGQIFLSETVLALCVTMSMFVLTTVGFALFNREVFTFVPFGMLATIYVGIVLATISFVSLMVLVSSCISNKAIASIVNILLILALSFSAYQVQHLLNQPEVYEGYSFEMDKETGELVETEYQIENPTYVREPMRTVLETFTDIVPYGQFIKYEPVFRPMLELYAIEEEEYEFYECFKDGVYNPPTEELKELRFLPLYQIGLTIILLGSGYLLFRRKDLK